MLRRYGGHGIRALSRRCPTPNGLRLTNGYGYDAALAPARCSGPLIFVQTRGKKTKTTVKVADLPQGLVPDDYLPPHTPEDDVHVPAYPTVVLQARRNMRKFDNCVLLTRVGGFYELYFEHAEEYGPLLNLKVATKKTNAGPVSMVRPRARLRKIY